MFAAIARFILRNRILLLIIMAIATAFFAWKATKVELSYEFAKILPSTDSTYIEYEKFKSQFGLDGTVMVIGIKDSDFFRLNKFNAWCELGNNIKKIDGIEAVVSVARLINIVRNDSTHQFDIRSIATDKLQTQAEVDSIKALIFSLPFYDNFIINKDEHAHLMAITFDNKKLNTKSRIDIVDEIKTQADAFSAKNKVELHYSGMPYIRTAISGKISHEMKLFLVLSIIVCAIILFVFFRSFTIVFFSLVVVLVGVTWSLGSIVLLGYNITALTGLIPPLIVVIGIPNSILLLNKYHTEYNRHNNQGMALSRMIQRIGLTTFLANVTTSIGFFVFYFTGSKLLVEFGLVASLNVMATYLISLVLIPIVFSFLSPPHTKQTKHLEAKRLNFILEKIDTIVRYHYRKVFAVVIIICAVSFVGMYKIKAVGYVVDDLPAKDPIYTDMKFFEENFHGVLPLEISIDTRKPNGVLNIGTLHKINKLEKILASYPEFSKPIAIVDAIKFTNQAFNYGNEKAFTLPLSTLQLADLSGYLGRNKNNPSMFKSFIDSTKQMTRISVQMADIGSVKMKPLLKDLTLRVDSIFPKDQFKTVITGNSLNFLKGNDYLAKNLIESLFLAIILITIIMFVLFMSPRMILISILPSIVPLIITAGIMGFFDIHLKPSTILIFSIAFGIASDQTIYFLTKYRFEMKHSSTISNAVTLTIRETGVSMIYTSIILFCGFGIFTASQFGGTASLGKLISITLLVAMLSNLILLPSFLIALERRLTTKAFLEDPFIQMYDEEEDIDLNELEIRKNGD
ncbi:MAG: MMPL family transporter [Bacteroidia bacterium]